MANIEIVRDVYTAFARGDIAGVMSAMAPMIIWNEAENFPYADRNPYFGPEAVAQGVFGRLASEWDGFGAIVEELLDAGDAIIALGRYVGVYKGTGRSIRAQFVHVWRAENGKLVGFQQHADTLQVARAMTR